MSEKFFRLFILSLCLVCICACSTKKKPDADFTRAEPVIEDLRKIPQNLDKFVTNPSKLLVSASEQEALARTFRNIYFGPWEMAKTSVKKRELQLFKNARGYKDANRKWTQTEWDEMAANASLGDYPNLNRPGITLVQTRLRELPSNEPRFSKPTPDVNENPFDYFQYSLLPPGMPLLLVHQSRDKKWYYIECPIASGWVYGPDLAEVNAEFQSIYRKNVLAAITRDDVKIFHGKNKTLAASIGAVFPMEGLAPNGDIEALIPVINNSGQVIAAEVTLPKADAAPQPVPLTEKNIARIGNVMLNQPYGWGGYLDRRDCSAMIRDLFAPFGIWLPRNSAAQAKRGYVLSLKSMTPAEKKDFILSNGVPFLSLLSMRGHIGLYIGPYKKEPAIFHNAWGLRIVKDGNDNERLVIGKAVITSITPGMEVENLYRPVTFVDRLNALTILGGK